MRREDTDTDAIAARRIVGSRIDASAALASLVDIRNRLLEVSEGFINVPEGFIEALAFKFDLISAAGAGDLTHRLNVANLDRVLCAAGGAREL